MWLAASRGVVMPGMGSSKRVDQLNAASRLYRHRSGSLQASAASRRPHCRLDRARRPRRRCKRTGLPKVSPGGPHKPNRSPCIVDTSSCKQIRAGLRELNIRLGLVHHSQPRSIGSLRFAPGARCTRAANSQTKDRPKAVSGWRCRPEVETTVNECCTASKAVTSQGRHRAGLSILT